MKIGGAQWRGLRALVDSGTSLPFTIRGHCMEPHLADGERIEIRRARLLVPGDIVAVPHPEGARAHRFLGYAPYHGRICAITAPDGPGPLDPPTPPSAVLGRADLRISLRERLRAVLRLGTVAARRVSLAASFGGKKR